MAVAILAMPARALADTVTIGQSDFDNAGGHLELTSADDRTYVLSENVVGSIDMYVTVADAKLTLDLNSHTLRCPASADRIAISIIVPKESGNLFHIKDGAVIQESDKVAIRTENKGLVNRETRLENLDVTAVNHACVSQESTGSVTIIGGSYTTLNTGDNNACVLYNGSTKMSIGGGTRVTLKGGGDTILGTEWPYADGIFLKDCSFSQSPRVEGIYTDRSQAFYKAAGDDAYWEVVPKNEELLCRDDCNYYVKRVVMWSVFDMPYYYYYFEDKDEAAAFKEKYSDVFSNLYTLIFTFSFNPDNGDLPTKLTVHYGDVVSRGSFDGGNDPVHDPYVFQGWKKDGKDDYDFSSKVTGNVTVNASWGVPAASINGKGYLTLEEAVEAASSGSTIVLFRDITRTERLNITDKGGIRLDLNGKTMTYSGSGAAIVVENTALTISDSDESDGGQINGASGCIQLNSGVLSIEGGTYTSNSVAIAALDGSLSISGGTVQSSSVDYDVTLTDAVGTVSGGYIKGYVRVNSDSDLRVTGGSFGTDTNRPSVPKGYHMLKGSDGRYTVAAHTWPNSYTYNGNGTHSRTCTAEGCNETDTAQCWGTTATCVKGRVCYTCGGEYTEPDSDNHVSAANEWTTDALKHWHKCTACGEVYPGTEADHTFTWVTDIEPTVSAPGREHEECSVCGYKNGNERAIPQLDGDAPAISGLTEGVAYDGATTFTVTDPDGDLVSVVAGGQTLTPGEDRKTYTLPNLGENIEVVAADANGNTTSVTVSSYADHDWTAWTSLGGTHERTCKHDGCTVKVQRGTCTGGEATCSAKAVCETCQGEYGDVDRSNHVAASEDWATSATRHWHKCTACGEVYPGTEADHTFTWVVDIEPTVTTEGSEHEECSTCHYKSGRTHVIPKYAGEAPVITGLTEGLAYDGVTTFTVTDADGDLVSVTANGESLAVGDDGSYTLPNLGENIEVVATDANGNTTKVIVSSYDDHNWSNWVHLGDGTHERTCRHSGCAVKTEQGVCTGGEATCSAGAKCEVCGYTYTDVDPENHVSVSEDWKHDDDAHWHVCNDCGAVLNKSEHVFEDRSDDDYTWRECTTCGFIKDKTQKPDSGDDDDDGKGDDEDDKGKDDQDGGSDEPDSGSDSKKVSPAKGDTLPATGDPSICAFGLVLAGAAVTAAGAYRRKR